ncbi:LOB domain-containing protein 19 [Prunus yedoensis var. nudiflora]|uniref:LOB domain-containing protein 19 n=1 Tax=Prunus yedoensis var. nudiflora TaxID=2094558 RepID=A0A314UQQ2_PRUYE|nr:LOB domain-containing protein 19 [Prunus yedoensis var. nudiflora]
MPPSFSCAYHPTRGSMLSSPSAMRLLLGLETLSMAAFLTFSPSNSSVLEPMALVPFVQVVNLQAELAYVQARVATFQRALPPPPPPQLECPPPPRSLHYSSSHINVTSSPCSEFVPTSNSLTHFDPLQTVPHTAEMTSLFNSLDQELIDGEDLQALARELVCRYLPGVRLNKPSTSHQNF